MLYILCTGVLTVLVGFGAICLKCKGNVTDFNNAFKIGVANSRDLWKRDNVTGIRENIHVFLYHSVFLIVCF